MVRLPRLALPDLPYHVTQRGNRRQPVFFRLGSPDFIDHLEHVTGRRLRRGRPGRPRILK